MTRVATLFFFIALNAVAQCPDPKKEDLDLFCASDAKSLCPAGALSKFETQQQQKLQGFLTGLGDSVRQYGASYNAKQQVKLAADKKKQDGPRNLNLHPFMTFQDETTLFIKMLKDRFQEIDRKEIEPIVAEVKRAQLAVIAHSNHSEADKKTLSNQVKSTQTLTFSKIEEDRDKVVQAAEALPSDSSVRTMLSSRFLPFLDRTRDGLECVWLLNWTNLKKLGKTPNPFNICGGSPGGCALDDLDMKKSWNKIKGDAEKFFNEPPLRGLEIPRLPVLTSPYISPLSMTGHSNCGSYVTAEGKITDQGRVLLRDQAEFQKLRLANKTDAEMKILADYQTQRSLHNEFDEACGNYGMIPQAKYIEYNCRTKSQYLLVCPGLLIGAGTSLEDKKRRLFFPIGHELGHSHDDLREDAFQKCMGKFSGELKSPTHFADFFTEMKADQWGAETMAAALPAPTESSMVAKVINQFNGQGTKTRLDQLDWARESAQPLCDPIAEGDSHPASTFRIKHFFLGNSSLRSAIGCKDDATSGCHLGAQ